VWDAADGTVDPVDVRRRIRLFRANALTVEDLIEPSARRWSTFEGRHLEWARDYRRTHLEGAEGVVLRLGQLLRLPGWR
jgi:hypothetical protein